MSSKADNPGAVGIIQEEQRPAVLICRSAYGGTLVLRKAPDLLPQYEMEDQGVYDDRLEQTVLFNATKKTIKTLTGIVFRKQPTIEETLLPAIRDHLENIDLTGQSIQVVAQQEFREKQIDGHVHILVDWHGPEGARSSLEEQRAGMGRPYWTLIFKSQEVRSEPKNDGGQTVLLSFAYEEQVIRRKGEFEQVEVNRIRQFDLTDSAGNIIKEDDPLPPEEGRRVLFRSWLETKPESKEWDVEEPGKLLGPNMNEIPVVTDYAERTGFGQSDPPHLDLALENLKHWQIRSDRDQSLHTVSIPVFCTFGPKAEDLQTFPVGTTYGFAFEGSRTDEGAEYVEAQGHGLEHTRTELLDIQQRMAALGSSMLERSTRQAETEDKVRLDQKGQDSELANQARLTNSALGEALRIHAKWLGKEPGGGIFLNTDYSALVLKAEDIDVLLKAVGEGALSLETFWGRLLVGKVLGDDFDPDLEKDRISQGGEASMRLIAEAMRATRTTQVGDNALPEAGGDAE